MGRCSSFRHSRPPPFCHSRPPPSVIPDRLPSVIPDVFNRESRGFPMQGIRRKGQKKDAGFPLKACGNDRGEEAGMTEGGFRLWQKRTGMTAKPAMTTKSGGAFPSRHSQRPPSAMPDRLPSVIPDCLPLRHPDRLPSVIPDVFNRESRGFFPYRAYEGRDKKERLDSR